MLNRFIRINGQDFSFDSVATALGIELPAGTSEHQIQLCQRVHDGILVAGGSSYESDAYPHIDVELQIPEDKDTLPILLTRSEQPEPTTTPEALRTFCYSREDEYFMFFDTDTRPDSAVDAELYPPSVTVSGSPIYSVSVKSENPYVSFEPFVPPRQRPSIRLSREEAQRLATDINDFQQLHDTYEYADRVADPDVHIDAICTLLLNGQFYFVLDYFKEFCQESRDPDTVTAANSLLTRLQAFMCGQSIAPDKPPLEHQISGASSRTANTPPTQGKSILRAPEK